MLEKTTILIIDKSSSSRKKMINALTGRCAGDDFIEAADGLEALRVLFSQKVDLIVSDWEARRVDGLKILQVARSHPKLFDLPIVFLSRRKSTKEIIKAWQAGASDFICRPFNAGELAARINNLLETRSFQETFKQKMKELEKLSVVDGLTGIYNRNYLGAALRREWKRSQRFQGMLGCLLIDVDFFKRINDTFGHKCGDEILKEIAGLISLHVRGYDFSCRYGGDEFIMILSNNTRKGIEIIADRLRQTIFLHTFLKKRKLDIKTTLSIGGAIFEGNKLKKPEDIIDAADRALFEAKRKGRNRVLIL